MTIPEEPTARRAARARSPRRLLWSGLVAAFALGFSLRGCLSEVPHDRTSTPVPGATGVAAVEWTCSMHPQIRQPNPGLCPICNMDLIPVSEGGKEDEHPRRFATTLEARALMQIETAPVERRFVESEIRMVGKVDYDETRLGRISAWVPGRIERMYADYTGIEVRKGDHMVDLYSPELLTAKEELLRASRALKSLPSGGPAALRDAAEGALQAVRRKLERWGLTDDQIALAEKEGVLADRVTIYAPMGGTVTERTGREGMYVETGETIYTIADLSAVWVRLEAFEQDMPWIHYGQTVVFTAEALPGERFEGRVAFVSPLLDERTRTVGVRVNVPNPGGRLKPGMFVRALVRARTATNGRVMDPGLAGKWISPMHPEIVKDGPGTCDVCGMPLVRAETLGYVSADPSGADMPLVVPASAVLRTGARAVVYVQVAGADRPTYEGREIVLGPRAGDAFLVASGLTEGERVVTNGAFKIDSELQIRAKPSMMSAPGPGAQAAAEPDAPEEFSAGLQAVLTAYLPLQDALAHDRGDDAATAVAGLRSALHAVDDGEPEDAAAVRWNQHVGGDLAAAAEQLEAAGTDLDALRRAFQTLSDSLIAAIRRFDIGGGRAVFRVHCPMAFDFAGADWIQTDEEIRNPYFGAEMHSCGTVEERLHVQDSPEEHSHAR